MIVPSLLSFRMSIVKRPAPVTPEAVYNAVIFGATVFRHRSQTQWRQNASIMPLSSTDNAYAQSLTFDHGITATRRTCPFLKRCRSAGLLEHGTSTQGSSGPAVFGRGSSSLCSLSTLGICQESQLATRTILLIYLSSRS
jgi:hypothetical protein